MTMLDKHPTPAVLATAGDNQAVDRAINRVLMRERAAREAVVACQQHAKAILDTARVRARTVEQRGEAREALLQVRCDRKVEETLDALIRQAPVMANTPSPAQWERLDWAIQRLCDEMVGDKEG